MSALGCGADAVGRLEAMGMERLKWLKVLEGEGRVLGFGSLVITGSTATGASTAEVAEVLLLHHFLVPCRWIAG